MLWEINGGGDKLFNTSVKSLMSQNFAFQHSAENKVKTSFSQKMQSKLTHCCRKYGKCKFLDTSAVTFPTERPDPNDQQRSLEPTVEVFMSSEEGAGEAVIDTGASRSVIGEERLGDLIQHVTRQAGWPIKKVSSNVQFRFGNSGTLQSRFAICIPRQQKGWIRVEVVPGRTPFLISNVVLKEMGILIDPRNQRLLFLDSATVIPLKTCRKSLLCVDIVELLKVEQGGEVKEEIYQVANTSSHTPAETHSTCQGELNIHTHAHKKPCPHFPPHIHTNKTELPTFFVQKPSTAVSTENLEAHAAKPEGQDSQETHDHHHPVSCESGHGPTALSRGRALWRGRSRSCTDRHLHECTRRRVPGSSRHSDTGRMGKTGGSDRETSWQNICPSVPGRQWLHHAGEEQKGSIALDEKFPELPASHVETPCKVDSSEPATIDSIDGIKSGRDIEDEYPAKVPITKSEQYDVSEGCRMGEDPNDQQGQFQQEAIDLEREQPDRKDEHRAQSEQDRPDSSADRNPPARAGPGKSNSQRTRRSMNATKYAFQDPSESPSQHLELLNESQILWIQEQISQKMTEIQGGLSNLKEKHPVLATSTHQKSYDSRPVDLLEVYCGPESQLTHQVNCLGGRAIRFTKRDGDLSTKEGVNKLWTWVEMYEPANIWVAPECRLWGSFSRFNMGRSLKMQYSILEQRKEDMCHLELCNALYLHQVAKGKHFHLEQPYGSEMTKQPQLDDVTMGTLPAIFDMCQAGKLKAPNQQHFLQKRTQVLTTSRIMHGILHAQNCTHEHAHQPIKGNVQGPDHTWIRLSAYAAAYTAIFARKVAQGIYKGRMCQEKPLLLEELLVGEEIENQKGSIKRPLAQEILELRKCRRRHEGKGPPTAEDNAEAPPNPEHERERERGWREVMNLLGKRTPRVGNAYCRLGDPEMQTVQQLIPHVEVRLVIMCRGTERHRIPNESFSREDIPLRKTIYVDRQTGSVVDLGPFEEWEKLSKMKQTRRAGPAKFSISIFGRRKRVLGLASVLPPKDDSIGSEPIHDPLHISKISEGSTPASGPSQSQEDQVPTASEDVIPEGWAPKIVPVHGPAFLKLSSQQRADLLRLHHNLGHPDSARLRRMLESQKVDPAIIAGAEDMQCDVCLESQPKPKLPHPGSIHDDLDFNDVVGADGAYWTSGTGETYHFMHFIDEGTLFHVGMVSGRTTEEQISTFEKAWLMWAGPCKTLYLDPAGEYVSPKWNDYLQGENIRVNMAAGDSHWQIGRAEIHGKIIKDMLSRMDKEEPIQNMADFQRCLRQAFAAKNSLSRARGYTPEQALLGKSRSLPASLTADENTSAHVLAESSTPEGIRFRESLRRREQARKAFIQSDNDSSCRRALLRRNRPGAIEYGAGDWVLYWRKLKGNPRGAKGRWHGPAQIIAVEQRRVVWLSHGGYLIRASPQHLRPASLREYRALPRNQHGEVVDEVIDPKTRNYHALTDVPQDDDENEYEPSMAPSVIGPLSSDQPEQEASPPLSFNGDVNTPEEEGMGDNLEGTPENGDFGGLGTPVPEDDDGLFSFGDDIQPSATPGVWEIEINEMLDIPHEEDLADKEFAEFILVATAAKRQRVEVRWRDLDDHDKTLFQKAKDKEVKAWIDHGTVKRLAKGSLPANRIMRCRWILSWKPPLPDTTEHRPKARLVILGYEDPDIGVVPNDAPTLSKDGKQLILQKVSSNRWPLLNFDISTAFLKGKGDGRALGIHPPQEISSALGLREGEQCGLSGGAYGRIDGPFLWYHAFRRTLEELGFIVCPLDGCVFSLITPNSHGDPQVRGILGIHVDDGIGGGDEYFMKIIENLREKYSFGAFNIGEFDFCGIRYRQQGDGSIELCQQGYIEKIEPIQVQRHRRKEPQSPVNEQERQCLRQLCGSLQYAAVQTRPDICAKVGLLQSSIPRACVEDLLEANRVLLEAKSHPVTILIVPIPESRVAFCGFSDASFETKKGVASRQGTIIFTTDGNMAENKLSVICPIAWSSRKIPRVVRSTLSAEASALSSSLDRVSWLRILWAWLCNPGIDWTSPTEILQKAPLATIATDCKSVYDLSTKTSTPSCEEFRTTLECLLIRERLAENCRLRWVSSQAMLADCLTKAMDGGTLRRALALGKYALFDELAILQQRADKRERLKWLSEQESRIQSCEMSNQENN